MEQENNNNKCEKKNQLISYNDIATKLLEDKLLLTALELHTEFIENGKEIRILKDFFSNPGNFEIISQQDFSNNKLSRSGSQITLDSLDLTRYSEDGTIGDERVAVLEFELRKAKETINALRNNLTVATESENSTPIKGSSSSSLRNMTNISSIKPHEQRALNFLINEYLLIQGYKLTSITFADENQNQDFDDWDDVGLNISKPPELIYVYREGLKQQNSSIINNNNNHISTQTEDIEEKIDKDDIIREQSCELEKLKSKVYFLETDLVEIQSITEELQKDYQKNQIQAKKSDLEEDVNKNNSDYHSESSPEKYKFVDVEDSNSINSYTNNWAKINIPPKSDDDNARKEFKDLSVENNYTKDVYSLCYIELEDSSSLINEEYLNILSKDFNDLDNLIHIVSQTLLKVISNIILNKREEIIPLLMIAIILNPKASERDKLLQQLFHLKKRPTEKERLTILAAVIAIAKQAGEQLVENEILPQCWLQLAHKHVERRLLIAEACTALIPYVSSPIRNSLILSMLQQMLEDKEECVREQIIKALALLFFHCEDLDKYSQCEQLALNTLKDSSNSVFLISSQVLMPILAKWALKTGCLSSSLFKKLLQKLNEHIVKNSESQQNEQIQRVLSVVDNLLPFLLILVAYQEPILNNIEKDVQVPLKSDFSNLCQSKLTNPENFMNNLNVNIGTILFEFDKYILENLNTSSWPEMDWVVDIMIPDLLNNLHHIDLTQQSLLEGFLQLFAHFCVIFGESFIQFKFRPILQKNIENLEQVISSFNQFCPSLNIIPIYVVVLKYTKNYEEISNILKKFLYALPLCGSPLDCLDITVKKLCEAQLQDLVVDCLWSGVVHQRPLVKVAAAHLFCSIIQFCSEELLKLKVVGAIITLASDSDILVRTATIPALGRLITNCNVREIHDKSYMQLQMFINDPNLKENHILSRQIIVTLGTIFASCSQNFQTDVILPQLTNFSNYMAQKMTNQTRKIDMALALVETFTHVVFNPSLLLNNKNNISNIIKQGLKSLETVILENSSLSMHHEIVLSMIKECDNKSTIHQSTNNYLLELSPSSSVMKKNSTSKLGQINVNQSVEDMRQRMMSKIFNKSTNISKN